MKTTEQKEKVQTFWDKFVEGWSLRVDCHAKPGHDAHKLVSTATRGKVSYEREWPLVGNSEDKTKSLISARDWCEDQVAKARSLVGSIN